MVDNITAADTVRHARTAGALGDPIAVFGPGRSTFDLRYIVAAIRSNLWLIGAVMAGCLAVALVATLLQTPRYTARTTVQINNTSGRILNEEENSDEVLGADYDTDRFLKTQTEVLKSRGLATRVAQKLNLTANPQFFASQEVPMPAPGTPLDRVRTMTAAMLVGNLTVTLPRDSRIVTIQFESTDPEMSAKIANTYASEFIQSNLQRKYDSSAYAREFLSAQLDDAKRRLEESERALNTYARGAGLIMTREAGSGDGKSGSNGSVTTSSLLQLNAAANEATARRIAAEGRWRAISSVPLMSATEVITNATVTGLLTQKAQIEAQLSEERARRLDDYPTVRSKRAQLDSISEQIRLTATNVRNAIRADYQAALDTERQLTQQVRALKTETLAEQDRTVQYGLLSRETDTNRQVYDGLLERYKQLNAIAGVSLSNVSVVDMASVPGWPSSPNLMKNLLAGFIAGVCLASLIVFLKDQFDDSIRVPEDVEAKLELPLLGVIPRARDEDPDESLSNPKSPISEAYNSLRSSLLYSTTAGLPQIMQITSAQPSEGKSTSSLAIALGFARMGKSALLIDADLRRPSLHRRVGCKNEVGLSSLLTSQMDLDDALVASPYENLSLLVSGPVPPSPTELLSSPRLEAILQAAATKFEVVIVDSPPILGLADAPLMSALVDGVVFVAEADRNRRGSLKTALRRLRSMRPIILGAVLTKFDPLKAGNQYSEYYGYEYYQYGDSTK